MATATARIAEKHMNDIQPSSNDLAVERTDLAVRRTLMALDRSFMALIRTSVSLIGFGFTIFKFLDALRAKGDVYLHANAPRNIGLFLILLGIGLVTLGLLRYKKWKDLLISDEKIALPMSLTAIAAVGVLLAGVFTILNILFGLGDF